MRYGRRILYGNNGDVEWVELDSEDVLRTLIDNVELNSTIYNKCVQAVCSNKGIKEAHDFAALALKQANTKLGEPANPAV